MVHFGHILTSLRSANFLKTLWRSGHWKSENRCSKQYMSDCENRHTVYCIGSKRNVAVNQWLFLDLLSRKKFKVFWLCLICEDFCRTFVSVLFIPTFLERPVSILSVGETILRIMILYSLLTQFSLSSPVASKNSICFPFSSLQVPRGFSEESNVQPDLLFTLPESISDPPTGPPVTFQCRGVHRYLR